jgi:hypothetical protein
MKQAFNRHSPDSGGFDARVAPLNGLGQQEITFAAGRQYKS